MTRNCLDHPILSGRYFYPYSSQFGQPYFVEGDGFRLGCRYLKVSDALPTIIHFHGNGETVADYVGDFTEQIVALGVNLLLADYRGYGMSTGTPALAAMLADVELIVKVAKVPPEQIIFFGRSLGSLYAVHGARLFPQAVGLIIESGVADPLERILLRVAPEDVGVDLAGLRKAVDRELNQERKLAAYRGRTLVMHAHGDDLVPVSHAERLYSWAREPKELIVFPRGDHNTILSANGKAYLAAVGQFVNAAKGATHRESSD